MPDNLETYPVTLVRSMVGVKDLDEKATPEARSAAHRRQADMLMELVTYILDVYGAAGYSPITLVSVLVTGLLRWSKEHKPHQPPPIT